MERMGKEAEKGERIKERRKKENEEKDRKLNDCGCQPDAKVKVS